MRYPTIIDNKMALAPNTIRIPDFTVPGFHSREPVETKAVNFNCWMWRSTKMKALPIHANSTGTAKTTVVGTDGYVK